MVDRPPLSPPPAPKSIPHKTPPICAHCQLFSQHQQQQQQHPFIASAAFGIAAAFVCQSYHFTSREDGQSKGCRKKEPCPAISPKDWLISRSISTAQNNKCPSVRPSPVKENEGTFGGGKWAGEKCKREMTSTC
ncbi:hypothetical protein niasHT_000058 [Heterodera trifolii]|uniref:Uncharacterized protein n=1 Tax=Heterodera trifolii TaxID=157864 RepID=A0ABD2MF19_9BILA